MNYLNYLPTELSVIIVSYFDDMDDIRHITTLLEFSNSNWKDLFYYKFPNIDIESVIPINWNYSYKFINLYYLPIYIRLLVAFNTAHYVLHFKEKIVIQFIYVSNLELIMSKSNANFNFLISDYYSDPSENSFVLKFRNNIWSSKLAGVIPDENDELEEIDIKEYREYSIKEVINLLTHIYYNGKSFYEGSGNESDEDY